MRKSDSKKKINVSPQGSFPGYYNLESNEKPVIRLFSYTGDNVKEANPSTTEELFSIIDAEPQSTHWIDVDGFGDNQFIEVLQKRFEIHSLEIEDMIDLKQRPKIEEYGNHLFLVSRMLYHHCDELVNEQVSFFVFKNVLLTVQEDKDDCFEPIRNRIRKGKGHIRISGTFYLAYALMDSIIDNYFVMLDTNNEKLYAIEQKLMKNPDKTLLNDIVKIKSELIQMRKAIWAERDKFNEILRGGYAQAQDEKLKLYLRDVYDHCIQITEFIESQKETAYGLMDVYMSSINYKLNEVMKVLTVISSVFIPLTFIVGVYGMNFSYTDAEGNKMPLNMPELYSPYGYVSVIAVMALIAIAQFIYFRKNKWI